MDPQSKTPAEQAGHTPGPWEYAPHGGSITAPTPADAKSVLPFVMIAETFSGGAGIEAANYNGYLIAAAPELLAMLKRCHAQMVANFGGSKLTALMSAEAREIVRAQMDRMKAIIAKAEGRAS